MDKTGKIDSAPESVHDELPPVEHMSFIQTIRRYKVASLMCVLAAVGALSDGYQVQMSGSIVALDGFINQFGELQSRGKVVVDPQYIALWGCKFSSTLLWTRLTAGNSQPLKMLLPWAAHCSARIPLTDLGVNG